MTNDEAVYLVKRLKTLCTELTELVNQAAEELGRIEQADTPQTDLVKDSPSLVKDLVKDEPKRGEWIKDHLGTVICSECQRPRRDNRVNHINFCNSCGARMRGADDEATDTV